VKNKLEAAAATTAAAYFSSGDFIDQFKEANPNFPLTDAYAESISKIMADFMADQTQQVDKMACYLIWQNEKGAWMMQDQGWTTEIGSAGLFTRQHATQISQQQFNGCGGAYAPALTVFMGDLPETYRRQLYDKMMVSLLPMKGLIS